MKLRNKKTGEIRELPDGFFCGDNLKKICEEWEDYEEPKEYWYIAELCGGLQKKQDTDNGEDRFNKQIGNYFDTREEAEKAVEKLKAVKRLKDNGFRLEGWTIDDGLRVSVCTNFDSDGIYDEYRKEVKKDLDTFFGGEE